MKDRQLGMFFLNNSRSILACLNHSSIISPVKKNYLKNKQIEPGVTQKV